ncbi:MAG: rod shape-determining protein RodA [Deltaproteobacteria bacterium]|nr:rod shape-determining protein RodA [Deltaproteobacteria bacterium]
MKARALVVGLDKELLIWVLLIATAGVINLFSAAQVARPGAQYLQVGYFAVGFAIAVGIAAIDLRWFERLAYPAFVVVCGLLALVLVAGATIKGSQRWLNLGFFNLQPSELMKLAIIFSLARYLARREEQGPLGLLDLLRPLNPSRPLLLLLAVIAKFGDLQIAQSAGLTWALRIGLLLIAVVWLAAAAYRMQSLAFAARTFVAPIDLIAVPAVLILIEPDLGTTLILLAIAGSMVLYVGVRIWSLVVIAVVGAAGGVAAWFKVLKPYQQQRILTFLNPEADALGAGYHANQSMIAIGSGRVQGKGFMSGTQTQLSFLPENHTDFAFSVLAEEWGLFGAAVLIILFGWLIIKGIRVAASAHDRFSALCAVGVAALIFWHVFVNIGMVTGMLPVVGVTLPLMSYGGSSVLTIMFGVGIWMSVSRRRMMF